MQSEARRKLATLTCDGLSTVAACASRRAELQELKRQVLSELMAVRGEVQQQAERPLGPRPTVGELWERREEGARALLRDVQQRVTGLVDGRQGSAVESWSAINQEIDRRLRELQKMEHRLSGRSAVDSSVAAVAVGEPGDELYAAAGARSGRPPSTCQQCRQLVDVADRFCRHCGQRLVP